MRGTHFAEMSAFVAVAEHGSFTKAAKHLRISNATISQTIRTLEERLGVRLLNRTTRSVATTEAGLRLLTQLRPLLDGFEDAVESVNASRDRPAGNVRLTVPPPAAHLLLAPLLARFLEQYPEIVVEISADAVLRDVVAGHFDAGIRSGRRIARDMIAVRIMDDVEHVVVASPDYIARHPRPQGPQDLQKHNCIRLRFPDGRFLPWRFSVEGKTCEFEVEGPLIVNDDALAICAALDGIGLFFAMTDRVAPLVAEGRLVTVLDDWMPPADESFYLYYPSGRKTPAALKALIEFLRNNFKSQDRDSAPPGAAKIHPAAHLNTVA